MIKQALKLAREGFHVFPGTPNAKAPPLISDFPRLATRDEATITKWWTQWPDANPYISTSRFGDEEALVVVDVDVSKGKEGLASFEELKKQHSFPKTKTQVTTTGGFHIIYRTPVALRQGVNVFGDGVDVRSKGGYIVGAGSKLGEKTYTANTSAVEIAPSWLIEKLSIAKENEVALIAPTIVPENVLEPRVVHYLTEEAPIAVKGGGGDHTAFVVAAHLKDMGCTERVALGFMFTVWNKRCPPGFRLARLQTIVHNAYKYGKNVQGVLAPESEFSVIESEDTGENPLEAINKEYALTYIDGGQLILHETVDEKGRFDLELLNETAFHKRLVNRPLFSADNKKPRSISHAWLEWPKRREYQKMVFAPERILPPQFYNTWRGFRVKPTPYQDAGKEAQSGFDSWKDHAFKTICGGNEEHFNWLIGFFAQMIQKPSERPLVDLTLIGAKGTGKNAFVERVGNLFQRGNFLLADNDRYILSNFNAHLERCILFVLDEAVWAGDKKSSGIMKGMTTKPTLLIERKGCEAYESDNLVRVVRLSNENWVVDASEDERRTAVFELNETNKQDLNFFYNMRVNMDEKGGNEVLLHYLKNFDLSQVEVNRIPETEALLKQKNISLSQIKLFWQEALADGQLYETEFEGGWQTEVSRKTFKDAYMKFRKDHNPRRWTETNEEITSFLVPYLVNCGEETRFVDPSGKRVRSYRFKPLKECREIWDKTLRRTSNWTD